MANQYTGSFECIIREKYNCSARDMLLDCQKNNLTYAQAGEKLGFKAVTIRKWSARYSIILKAGDIDKTPMSKSEFMKFFHSSSINEYNILNRLWL